MTQNHDLVILQEAYAMSVRAAFGGLVKNLQSPDRDVEDTKSQEACAQVFTEAVKNAKLALAIAKEKIGEC